MKKVKLLLLLLVLSLNLNAQNNPDLEVVGGIKVNGNSTVELGKGLTKEPNAGKIGYATFTPQTLDIVGAGTTGTTRKIKFWNEGGASFADKVGVGVANPQEMLDVNGLVYARQGILYPDQTIQTSAFVAASGGTETFPNINAQPKPQPFALITAASSPFITDTLEIVSITEGAISMGGAGATIEPFVVRVNFERATQDILRKLTQGQAFTKFAIYMPEGDGVNYRTLELKTAMLKKMKFTSNYIGNNAYANVIDLSLEYGQIQIRSMNPSSCFCWSVTGNTSCICN